MTGSDSGAAVGTPQAELRIEAGTESDIPVILRPIEALAEHDRLAGEVVAAEERLRGSLFGESAAAGACWLHCSPTAFVKAAIAAATANF